MVCICLNTIVLAIKWFGMSASVVTAIEYINYVFMFIFTLEAIIKIIALKLNYFRDSWNIFDFTVVIGTVLILLIS